MDPLPEVSGKQEVVDTADHVLETFYPVSPTIDLQKVHVYKEEVNCSGEKMPSPLSCLEIIIIVSFPEAERSLSTVQV